MDLFVKGEDVWVTSISDDPGSLGKTLGLLSDAGANLDFIISRRAPDEPETAVVFVTPCGPTMKCRRATMPGSPLLV